jgi:hypothetical protein
MDRNLFINPQTRGLSLLKRTYVSLIVIVLLLASCAGPKVISEEQKLKNELTKWESFDSEGVIEISYLGLAMRKMFSLSKNRDQMRFDIIDGGVMGAGAQPLMSFYLGDYISFKSPYLPMLELLDVSSMIPLDGMAIFSNTDSLVASYGQQIIKNKQLEIAGINLIFKPDYKLDKLFDPRTKMELRPLYSSSGKLSELNLRGADNLSLKLSFDKLEYAQPQIIALPKPKPNVLADTLKGIDSLDLKTLLKEMIQSKQDNE